MSYNRSEARREYPAGRWDLLIAWLRLSSTPQYRAAALRHAEQDKLFEETHES